MINEIKVNTTRLGNDAEKVKEYIDNIEKARKQIQTRASNINSMWDGQASEAFQKAIKSDLKELKEMIKNLKQVYDYETNAKKKYETCEEKVAELIAQIKV